MLKRSRILSDPFERISRVIYNPAAKKYQIGMCTRVHSNTGASGIGGRLLDNQATARFYIQHILIYVTMSIDAHEEFKENLFYHSFYQLFLWIEELWSLRLQ